MPLNRNKRIETQVALGFEDIRRSMFQVVENQLLSIDKSRIAGMTDEAIFNSMKEGWEQPFLNSAAQTVWENMKFVAQESVYSSLPMSDLYQWQYNPDAQHCKVCTRLNGQIKSLQEWQADGMPGRRQEGCYANCCCDLVRVKSTKMESIRKDSTTNQPLQMNINYSTFLERDFNTTIRETDSNGVVTEYLTREKAEELYITLNQVKKEIGGNTFNRLDRITTFRQLDENLRGIYEQYGTNGNEFWRNTLGAFLPEEVMGINAIGLNSDYYGPNANENNSALVKQYKRSLKNIARHESGHYLLWKYNLTNDPEIVSFFNENRTYISECFPFIAQKEQGTREDVYTEEQKPQEFFVEAFSWLLGGRLRKMGPNQELNDRIQSFIQKKVESLKQIEKGNG